MKRHIYILLALCSTLFICATPAFAGELFQVSTFATFAQGQYEGPVTIKQLRHHGNFGIGTINGLDGEMIALDGQFVHVRTDGKAYSIDDAQHTPFGMVIDFKPDKKLSIAGVSDGKKLHDSLDEALSDKSGIYAFKIVGDFKRLKVRSVPKQQKPYPILEEVIKDQTVFHLANVKATLVGFRFPDFMKGVNAPGYHFHCLTADKSAGGHVLDCEIQQAEVEMQAVSSFAMRLVPRD